MSKVDMAITVAKRMLVDSIWKSAGIEGINTTFIATEDILNHGETHGMKSDDVMFIMNMKAAWQFLFDVINEPNNLAIIREFNKICGNNLIYGCGELRTIDVAIGGTAWKPSIPFHGDVIAEIEQLNSISDSEGKAIAFFCYLARRQMFIDGNKRVAQLICNKILIENGIGILNIKYEDHEEFKIKLLYYYETGNPNDLFLFIKNKCIERV